MLHKTFQENVLANVGDLAYFQRMSVIQEEREEKTNDHIFVDSMDKFFQNQKNLQNFEKKQSKSKSLKICIFVASASLLGALLSLVVILLTNYKT